MLTLTCFLLTHWPPTWKRRFFAFRARMVRPWSPNWCVAACFAFVPTANPEASAVTWIELRSCEESMRVFPPVVAARMEVFHLRRPALVPLETLKGGLSDAFAEGHVEAPSVYFRVSPHFSEECGGLSFKADTIHELHPPHLRPRE